MIKIKLKPYEVVKYEKDYDFSGRNGVILRDIKTNKEYAEIVPTKWKETYFWMITSQNGEVEYSKEFKSIKSAKLSLNKKLKKVGYILLTEEQYEKMAILI